MIWLKTGFEKIHSFIVFVMDMIIKLIYVKSFAFCVSLKSLFLIKIGYEAALT